MADTFTIEVEGRRVECRRPTHGELDLAMLERLVGVFAGYRKKILEIEERPTPGCAEKIASYAEIGSDAAARIQERVWRALPTIAVDTPPACVGAWLNEYADDEAAVAQRAVAVAVALIDALVPRGAVGK